MPRGAKSDETARPPLARTAIGYGLMLAATLVAFLVIRHFRQDLTPPKVVPISSDAGAAAYTAVMLLLVRPAARRLAFRWQSDKLPRGAVALVFVALLTSAAATQWIGIHALFGAFLLGVVIPHDSPVAQAFSQQLRNVTTVLLLPAFFAFTGMQTNIRLLNTADQ